jgi:hypothetical protein
MIVIRLIGDSARKELSMANELCLDDSLARPAFSSFFVFVTALRHANLEIPNMASPNYH